jgi:hypothetical protein
MPVPSGNSPKATIHVKVSQDRWYRTDLLGVITGCRVGATDCRRAKIERAIHVPVERAGSGHQLA